MDGNLIIRDNVGISTQNPLSSLSRYVNRIVIAITITLMALMVIVVGVQVFYRFVLNDSLPWSDEVARYLFFWIIFLGATIGVKEKLHPSFGAVIQVAPPTIQPTIAMIGRILVIGFCMVLFNLSLHVMPTIGLSLSPALQIPLSYLYFIFPIFSVLAILHTLAHIWEERRGIPKIGWFLAIIVLVGVVYTSISTEHFHFNFSLVLVICLLVLFSVGLPIAFVLGITSVGLIFLSTQIPMIIIPQRIFLLSDNFSLMAIPFFMLTGALMQVGGVAERLVTLVSALVGWVRGGLGYANIIVSAFFADISGSAVADTAAIGSVMLPGMIKRGYDNHLLQLCKLHRVL